MIFIKKLFSLMLLSAIAVVAILAYWSFQPLDSSDQNKKTLDFNIKSGSGVRGAARQIGDAGVPVNPYLFEILARATGNANKLKAGSFEANLDESPWRLLNKIVNGEFSQASVSIIEGWTFQQMRKVIDAHPAIRHDTLGMSAPELMQKMNSAYQLPEGLFYPDTYLFAKGSSDLLIYQQAHQAMLKRMEDVWASKSAALPYKNMYEALIMASIIEKETGQSSERTMIAAVFINRLKLGMLLQTDPTVIYGMGELYKGKIRKVDLLTDTPYNTYTRSGMPPTPIALPGLASLSAAMRPEKSDALYFVSRGDGSSQFSSNLVEHNRAVNKYQR